MLSGLRSENNESRRSRQEENGQTRLRRKRYQVSGELTSVNYAALAVKFIVEVSQAVRQITYVCVQFFAIEHRASEKLGYGLVRTQKGREGSLSKPFKHHEQPRRAADAQEIDNASGFRSGEDSNFRIELFACDVISQTFFFDHLDDHLGRDPIDGEICDE